jgi:hypothetical protein
MRTVNGIIGILCRQHFLGMVEYGGVWEPAYMFEHYAAAPDAEDREGRVFNNKAEWVKKELLVVLNKSHINCIILYHK